MGDHEERSEVEASESNKPAFTEEEVSELRDYFAKMTCSLRVLGSQLGLEPHELNELEENYKKLADRKQMLLQVCLRKEKLMSWEQLSITLEKPALKMTALATEIRQKHVSDSKQASFDSMTSHSSVNSPTSPMEVSPDYQVLSINDLSEVFEELYDACTKWYNIGLKLKIKPAKLDVISKNHRGDSETCFRELLSTWLRDKVDPKPTWATLVDVLKSRTVGLVQLSDVINEKYLSVYKHSPVSPSSVYSLTSPALSLSSAMEVSHDLTIPEAVNMIMVVSVAQLRELGRNLGLEESDHEAISYSYDVKEHHQRLIEKWFDQKPKRSREMLIEALPGRDSSVLMIGVLPTPPPEPLIESAVPLQISNFEQEFCNLQADTEQDLINRNKSVENVTRKLKYPPEKINREYYHKFVKNLVKQPRKYESFEKLFYDLRKYCWSSLDYEVLQFIIESNCRGQLMSRMKEYASRMEHFKKVTTISVFMKYGREFFIRKKVSFTQMSKLKSKHSVNPDQHTLADLDRMREEIWEIESKLSECLMQIYSLNKGCVEVEWIIPEEFDYDFITFFFTEVGKDLLERHQIIEVYLNDMLVDNSLFLLTASIHKDWDRVDLLLQEDVDLNKTQQGSGRPALFFVSANGRADLVRKMLEREADPNIQDNEGRTALMEAVEGEQVETVKVFLQEQCDLNIQENTHGWSVLHFSAAKGLVGILELLIDPSYDIDFSLQDMIGKTALQLAEERGHTQVVEMLKTVNNPEEDRPPRRGMFQWLRDRWQRNTQEIKLNRAAARGSLADVQKALDNKADPNCITNQLTKRTPLMEASERGHTEVVKELLKRDGDPTKTSADGKTALILASKHGHVETVKELLSSPRTREVINAVAGVWRWTALHSIGFYRGHDKRYTKEEFPERMKKIAELLLDGGADPFIGDRTGDTALSLASYRGYDELVELIIEKTPKERRKELIDHQRNDKWSALLLAARHGRTKVVKILLNAGASMTVSNKSKMTALHLGVSKQQTDTVKEIVSKADPSAINAVDDHGYTPLIIAIKVKNLELVEVLMNAGADPNTQTSKEKKTALMYAAKLNSLAMVKVLVEYKPDVTITDANQQPARTQTSNKSIHKLIDRLFQEREQQQQQQIQAAEDVSQPIAV